MPTLVTGATGFLGRHLVPLLLDHHVVRALVRRPGDPDADALRRLGVDVLHGEIGDRQAVVRAAAGCEVVYHLAGLVSHERSNWPRLRRVNVEGTRTVLEATRGARVVYVSSVAAIGPAPARHQVADETQPFPDGALRLPYAATKREAEGVVAAAVEAGADAVVACPGFLLGPGDVHRVSTWHVERHLRGTLRVSVPGGLSNVDARDVAVGLVALAERGRRGERYVLTSRDGNLSHADFFHRVQSVTGVRRLTFQVPVALGVVGATMRLQPVTPDEVRAAGHWWFYDPGKAERELGFATRPLDETIAATAADFGYPIPAR